MFRVLSKDSLNSLSNKELKLIFTQNDILTLEWPREGLTSELCFV